jgi:DNA-binding transcriptional ArsR family regulator
VVSYDRGPMGGPIMSNPMPYHAIADANRRRILDLLRDQGPLRAGDIVAHLSHISQPAVSKHLRVLREAELVRDVRDGRERWYHLNPDPLHQVAQWLQHYGPLWDSRLATLKQLVEQEDRQDRE